MKDLNFFSIYQTNRKERKDNKQYIYIIAAVVAGVVFFTLAWNVVKIIMLYNEIKSYNAKYNAEDFQRQLNEANTINDKLGILTEYEGSLSEVVKAVNKNDIVDEKLLVDISNAVPGDISFTEWKTENYQITMKGTSHSRAAVAELEHNLRELSQFKFVHVDKIKTGETVGDDYTFEMTTILKEVE